MERLSLKNCQLALRQLLTPRRCSLVDIWDVGNRATHGAAAWAPTEPPCSSLPCSHAPALSDVLPDLRLQLSRSDLLSASCALTGFDELSDAFFIQHRHLQPRVSRIGRRCSTCATGGGGGTSLVAAVPLLVVDARCGTAPRSVAQPRHLLQRDSRRGPPCNDLTSPIGLDKGDRPRRSSGRATYSLESSASAPRQRTLVIPPPPADSAHVPLQFRSFGKSQYQHKRHVQLPGGYSSRRLFSCARGRSRHTRAADMRSPMWLSSSAHAALRAAAAFLISTRRPRARIRFWAPLRRWL